MRETDFINNNKNKWSEFEKAISNKTNDPNEMSKVFVELTDDLSYARTHYPSRSVRVYLNASAQHIYNSLYKSEGRLLKGFGNFWTRRIPEAMWYSRWALLISFSIFAFSFLLGFYSSSQNPEYAGWVLGEGYIEMTRENIANDDPMAVYKQMPPMEMFLYIAQNNIRVCFQVFIMGILAGIGTLVSLISEGARIGAFFQFFAGQDLGLTAFLTVMLHGTIELSLIVLAGCAGLTLAGGLLFPGALTRMQSLIVAARRSLTVSIGIAAVLLLAAFIESFITRLTEMPMEMKLALILFSFAFILLYFVIYPWLLHRKGKFSEKPFQELRADSVSSISWNEVKKASQIFRETFSILLSHQRKFVLYSLVIGLASAAAILLIAQHQFPELTFDEEIYLATPQMVVQSFFSWLSVLPYLRIDVYPALILAYTLIGMVLIYRVGALLSKQTPAIAKEGHPMGIHLLNSAITALLLTCTFLLSSGIQMLIVAFLWPVIFFLHSIARQQNTSIFKAIGSLGKNLKGQWGRLMGVTWMLTFIPWLILLIADSAVWYILDWFVSLNIRPTWQWGPYISPFILCWIILSVTTYCLIQYLIGYELFTASAHEVVHAKSLRGRISEIRPRRQAYGLDKE